MTAPAAPAAAPKGRLGNGQLRRQVAEYLADHPGPCKTGEIAKALGRSAGAVGNALTTLAGRRRGRPRTRQAHPLPGELRHRRRSRRHRAQGTPPAQAAPRPPGRRPRRPRALARPAPASTPTPAAAGPVTRPNGQVYQPRALADMPDVEALRKLRDGGRAGPAVRAARYRQDQPDRGGLPRPDHRRRRRRHHRRRPGRRVHPEPRRHLHLHLRAADQGHAGGAGPLHRRRHPHLAGGAGGRLPRDGRPARDHRQGPQRRDDQGGRRLLRSSRPQPGSPRRDPHRGPLQPVLGPGQGLHRLRPRPRPQDRPPRDQGRPRPRRPAGQRRDRLGTPAPRAPRLRQGRRASSARTPPSPTWSASPPRKTATP